MQVQRPEGDVHVEPQGVGASFRNRRVDAEEGRPDVDRKRAVWRRGESDGDERGEDDQRPDEGPSEPGSKGHASGTARGMPERDGPIRRDLPGKSAGRSLPAVRVFGCGTKPSRLRAMRFVKSGAP